jgi:hypothetical protein
MKSVSWESTSTLVALRKGGGRYGCTVLPFAGSWYVRIWVLHGSARGLHVGPGSGQRRGNGGPGAYVRIRHMLEQWAGKIFLS